MKIELDITKDELAVLIGFVVSYEDSGPTGETWQSDELISLGYKIKVAIGLGDAEE